MSAKTELIKFRVTAAEKAQIVTAAGGTRQLSAYLRGLALRGYEAGGVEQSAEDSESVALLPAPQPSADAGLPTPVTDEALPVPNKAKPAAQCARWYNHRRGTYCGSCKTVPLPKAK